MKIPNIVVLEDDVSCIKLLDRFLTKEFIVTAQVTLTTNAADVIQLATDGKLDICLTDIDMPAVSGFSVLKTLKRIDPLIQVIMMTALTEWNTVESAYSLGACDYVLKPFEQVEIREVMQAAITRYQRQKRDFSKLVKSCYCEV